MTEWIQAGSEALRWEHAGKRICELRAGAGLAARLSFRSAWGSLALGECAAGSWTFKRVGFFRPYVTVRREGSEVDEAVLRSEHRVTELRFVDGRRYVWRRTRARRPETSFVDPSGRAMVTFSPEKRGRAAPASVRLETAVLPPGIAELLALVLGYRLVLEQMDEEAAVIAATAAAISAAAS